MFDTGSISLWLKNTVPGLVLLGAVGSVLAYYLLRFGRWTSGWALRRLLIPVFMRLGLFNLRQVLIQRRLLRTMREKQDLVGQIVPFMVYQRSITTTFRRMLLTVAGTVGYLYLYGVHLTWASGLLAVVSFLLFYLWVVDLILPMGVFMPFVYAPYALERRALEDPKMFKAEADALIEAIRRISRKEGRGSGPQGDQPASS